MREHSASFQSRRLGEGICPGAIQGSGVEPNLFCFPCDIVVLEVKEPGNLSRSARSPDMVTILVGPGRGCGVLRRTCGGPAEAAIGQCNPKLWPTGKMETVIVMAYFGLAGSPVRVGGISAVEE